MSYQAATVWYGKSQASSAQGGNPSEEFQELLWHELFSDPTRWWDNRRSGHPELKHKKFKIALWLTNRQKLAWLEPKLAKWAAGPVAKHEGHLEVGMCSEICDNGPIADAVDALNLLVQRGCHIHNNLFYRVLRRCIASKDLVLGRRIHALIIESGYEGDAFLATHLIGLYASHESLDEAMRVFSKVPTPTAYTWATIIFACARHGEAAQAIRLYRQIRQSTTEPDNRVFVAVVKACATARDLVAGKEVHAHILASPEKPDAFVQTGLLAMYAKCGSLEDARKVFFRLPHRDVATWNAIISGYAQQGLGQQALNLYNVMQREGITSPNSVTFVCLLQACASVGVGALEQGKKLHGQIEEQKLQDDVVLGCSLVNMYVKCGSLVDARSVFDSLPDRNVVTWTAMIAGYAEQGMGEEALGLYSRMKQEGLYPPDSVTFVCLLQACAGLGVAALHEGKQLHGQIEGGGLQNDLVLGCSLVNMYAKCGSLKDARKVFDRIPDRNVVTWTTMIAGYAQQGMGQEALSLYSEMQQEVLSPPSSVTIVCLLQACASVGAGALQQGHQLHAQIVEQGLQDDVILGCSLVNMYAKCGSVEDARTVFDRLPDKNVVTWTAMIAGYAQQGMGQEALGLYSRMQEEGHSPPSSVTFVCLLQACASVGVEALHQGKQLHAQIEERGLQFDEVLGGSLVNMYAKCGSVEDTRSLFDSLPNRNMATWNAMLAAYVQEGMGQEALSLFRCMQQEGLSPGSSVTFLCLLQACASVGIGALDEGKEVHSQIKERGLEDDVILGSSLVNMYAKCGSLQDACKVFDRLRHKDVVTWTVMIAAYAQQGMGQEALRLHSSMQQEGYSPPDSVTFVCLLQACASVGVGALHQGRQLHMQIEERGLQDEMVVGCSLVNMYAKCGGLEDARNIFDSLPHRDVVTWTAMLAGYTHQGMVYEALSLYRSMQHEGLCPPNSATFVCLLQACGTVAGLPLGKQVHLEIEERGMQADVVVGAALVNMYAKCGSMVDSQQVFDTLPERTMEAWGALISGYTRRGDSEIVFELLDRMRVEGIEPNGITFLSLLTACSHVGLVDKGRKYFELMRTDFGISPTVEHYTCMMDLMGRAGHLDEALEMAKTMPVPINGAVWHSLLGACQKWNNVEIGQQAFEFAVSLDEKDAASYLLMSNIYARAEMWEEADEVHARRVRHGAWKKPGQCWWTDTGGVVHTFVVGDKQQSDSGSVSLRVETRLPSPALR